jgi:hypothetical protein
LGVPHRALKDVQIGNYSIEKGSTVSGSLYHAMRDKRFFENPEIFNPQRFLDKGIPYILVYKSRNFGRFLELIFSIRLIRGSNFIKSKTLKNWLFLHFEGLIRRKKAFKISEFWT